MCADMRTHVGPIWLIDGRGQRLRRAHMRSLISMWVIKVQHCVSGYCVFARPHAHVKWFFNRFEAETVSNRLCRAILGSLGASLAPFWAILG